MSTAVTTASLSRFSTAVDNPKKGRRLLRRVGGCLETYLLARWTWRDVWGYIAASLTVILALWDPGTSTAGR